MLNFKRAENARVIITVPPSTRPTQITVVVTECARHYSRLGIDAPRAVVVDREEIHLAKGGK